MFWEPLQNLDHVLGTALELGPCFGNPFVRTEGPRFGKNLAHGLDVSFLDVRVGSFFPVSVLQVEHSVG